MDKGSDSVEYTNGYLSVTTFNNPFSWLDTEKLLSTSLILPFHPFFIRDGFGRKRLRTRNYIVFTENLLGNGPDEADNVSLSSGSTPSAAT